MANFPSFSFWWFHIHKRVPAAWWGIISWLPWPYNPKYVAVISRYSPFWVPIVIPSFSVFLSVDYYSVPSWWCPVGICIKWWVISTRTYIGWKLKVDICVFIQGSKRCLYKILTWILSSFPPVHFVLVRSKLSFELFDKISILFGRGGRVEQGHVGENVKEKEKKVKIMAKCKAKEQNIGEWRKH